MTCNICCDEYNKSIRSKINCQYCDFDVCRTCCETYILSETIPKCMKPECAKEWSRKFLRENFTQVFLNSKYKEHIENILFDQEKALMPETQLIVEDQKRLKTIQKEIDKISQEIKRLTEYRQELYNSRYEHHSDVKGYAKQFVRQCPAPSCRGFLSTQWKCGLCEQWTCPNCHELKGFDKNCLHECNPDMVASAKLLEKDSKPCPKCQSLIFKISGCDQMWCTQCHTAFSWKTGQIETNIHNPHYYEWQRQQNKVIPRTDGDIECGRELNSQLIDIIGTHMKIKCSPDRFDILKTFKNVIHNQFAELPKFTTNGQEFNQINLNSRIKYITGEIDEKTFKELIQRADKRTRKNREISQVIRLSNTVMTDIAHRMKDYIKTATPVNFFSGGNCDYQVDQYRQEITAIINYCNEIFEDISQTYKCPKYMFTDAFLFKNGSNLKFTGGDLNILFNEKH